MYAVVWHEYSADGRVFTNDNGGLESALDMFETRKSNGLWHCVVYDKDLNEKEKYEAPRLMMMKQHFDKMKEFAENALRT